MSTSLRFGLPTYSLPFVFCSSFLFLQIFAFFVVCIAHRQYCRFRNTRQSIRLHSFSIIICHVEVFPLRVTQSKCAWAMLDCVSAWLYIHFHFSIQGPWKWSSASVVYLHECTRKWMPYYIDLHIFCMFHIIGLKQSYRHIETGHFCTIQQESWSVVMDMFLSECLTAYRKGHLSSAHFHSRTGTVLLITRNVVCVSNKHWSNQGV